MNLQYELQSISNDIVDVVGEDFRDDIDYILYDRLDSLLKDYAMLRDIPFGEIDD